MQPSPRPVRPDSPQQGFTLAEVLVACAVIAVGLVAVHAGFGYGVDGVEAGRQQSTAVFLAEQQIERAKELAVRTPNLADLTAANLPASEGYGTIAGAPGFRRTTAIVNNPSGVVGARVDVVVLYRPVTGRGVLTTEQAAALSIFFASR